MTGPGGRNRRRDPKRKDRAEEMQELLGAATESMAPLAMALGSMVRSFAEAVSGPKPAPPPPEPVVVVQVEPEPSPAKTRRKSPARKPAAAKAAAKPAAVKPASRPTTPKPKRSRTGG